MRYPNSAICTSSDHSIAVWWEIYRIYSLPVMPIDLDGLQGNQDRVSHAGKSVNAISLVPKHGLEHYIPLLSLQWCSVTRNPLRQRVWKFCARRAVQRDCLILPPLASHTVPGFERYHHQLMLMMAVTVGLEYRINSTFTFDFYSSCSIWKYW